MLITNSTHIMQSIDNNVGRFIQQQIQAKYREVLLAQEKEMNDKNLIKKLCVGDIRLISSKCISNILGRSN